MISVRSSNKKKKKAVDTSYLACKYLALMAGSVGDFVKENRRDNEDPVRCLLIGLGGGPLASFLSKNFGHQERKKIKLCLAKEMCLLQTRWCPTHSLTESNRLKSTPTLGAGARIRESD